MLKKSQIVILHALFLLLLFGCGPKIVLKSKQVRSATAAFGTVQDIEFGNVVVGLESVDFLVTVTNTTTSILENCLSASISGTEGSSFSVTDNCSQTIPPGNINNCTLIVKATPTSEGDKSATITKTCGGTSFSLDVTVTGVDDFTSFSLTGNSPYSNNYTSSSTVTVNFTGEENATAYCFTEDVSGSDCSWQGSIVSGVTTYSLATSTNETKTVYSFKYDDYAQYTDGTSSSIIFDDTNPSTPSLTDSTHSYYNSTSLSIAFAGGTDDNLYTRQGMACLNAGCNSGCTSDSTTSSSPITYSNMSDDAFYFCLKAIDYAGNESSYGVTSAPVVIDTVPPVLTFTSTPTNLEGNATFDLGFTLTELNAAADSSIGIYFFNGSSWSFLDDVTTAAGPLSSVAFTYQITAPAIDVTNAAYRISYTDLASNISTTDSSPFTIDNTPPTVGTLTINGGSGTTISNIVEVNMTATDDITPISHICLKYDDSSDPLASDSCWVSVESAQIGITSATSISVTNFNLLLGFTIKSYNVFGFAKNAINLISALSNSGDGTTGIDMNSISYDPETPPSITNVIATNTDVPTNPPTTGELTIGATDDVYIKWNASDVEGLAANPITIYSTTDDVNFTEVANSLTNGANSACNPDDGGTTLDDGNTGCYIWATPNMSSYFKIRVGVTDDKGYTSFSSSLPLNTSTLSFIAGNTDTGLGGVATSAIFSHTATAGLEADSCSFVMSRDGTLYFRDPTQGILKIDPATKIVTKMIPITGTRSGDGGHYSNATLYYVQKLSIDASDNLLIFDNNVIRKVDMGTGIIDTIIGGGTDTSNTIANPLDVFIYEQSNPTTNGGVSLLKHHFLQPLPNGDIYFTSSPYNSVSNIEIRSEGGWKLRKYDGATGAITSILPSGTSFLNSTQDAASCIISQVAFDYDLNTSAINYIFIEMHQQGKPNCKNDLGRLDITGATMATSDVAPGGAADWRFFYPTNARDGKILLAHTQVGSVYLLDKDTPALNRIYGTGSSSWGVCNDGSAATACNAFVYDAFRNENGDTFVSENGVIRVIDKNGNVQTVYGQRKNYGDGGIATNARFGDITSIQMANSGNIYALDADSKYLRKFTRGGNVSVVAGNGTFQSVTDGVNVTADGMIPGAWWVDDYFIIDPNREIVFYGDANLMLYYAPTQDGKWHKIVGGGSQDFHDTTADGALGTSLKLRMPTPIGYDTSDDRILTVPHDYDFVPYLNYMVKTYDATGGTQHHVAGINTQNGSWDDDCVDGSPANTCDISWMVQGGILLPAYFDISSDGSKRWMFHGNVANYSHDQKITTLTEGGTKETLLTAPRSFKSFTYHRFSGPEKEIVWYCDNTNNQIYQYNVTDATEAALDWPIAEMTCTGYNIIYDATNASIIFPYKLNGISGVAEHSGIYPSL